MFRENCYYWSCWTNKKPQPEGLVLFFRPTVLEMTYVE